MILTQGIHKLDRFLHVSMLLLLLLLKNGEGDVCTGRRCSAKEIVFGSLPNFCCLKKRSGMNRICHPNWVKLCIELNCAPNQNTFYYIYINLHIYIYIKICIYINLHTYIYINLHIHIYINLHIYIYIYI